MYEGIIERSLRRTKISYLTMGQIAEYLSVSKRTVYNYTIIGKSIGNDTYIKLMRRDDGHIDKEHFLEFLYKTKPPRPKPMLWRQKLVDAVI